MARSAKAAAKRGSTEGRRTTRASRENQLKELREELRLKQKTAALFQEALEKEAATVQGWLACQRESLDFIAEIDREKLAIKKQVCDSLAVFPRRLVCPLMRRAVGFNERIVSSRCRVQDMMTDTQRKIDEAELRMQALRRRLAATKRRVASLKREITKASLLS